VPTTIGIVLEIRTPIPDRRPAARYTDVRSIGCRVEAAEVCTGVIRPSMIPPRISVDGSSPSGSSGYEYVFQPILDDEHVDVEAV
jgi:hypothetical protein